MIAALIVVLSVAALIQFAHSQWRAMWITIAEQPLSEFFTATTGISGDQIRADHFDFLTRTSEQLGSSAKQSNLWVKKSPSITAPSVLSTSSVNDTSPFLRPGPITNWWRVPDTQPPP